MSSLPADAAKASPRSSVSTGREPIVRDYASLGGPASRPIQDSQGNAPSVPSDATARPQLNLIADSDASGYHSFSNGVSPPQDAAPAYEARPEHEGFSKPGYVSEATFQVWQAAQRHDEPPTSTAEHAQMTMSQKCGLTLFILLLYAVNTALVYGALMIVEGIEHSSSSYDNARGALAGITNRLADDRPSTKTIASIAGLAGFLTTCTCVPMIVYALFLKKRLAVLHEAAGALR